MRRLYQVSPIPVLERVCSYAIICAGVSTHPIDRRPYKARTLPTFSGVLIIASSGAAPFSLIPPAAYVVAKLPVGARLYFGDTSNAETSASESLLLHI